MKLITIQILLICLLGFIGCNNSGQTGTKSADLKAAETNAQNPADTAPSNSAETAKSEANAENKSAFTGDEKGPKTVREFFTLLPDKYFLLEGCDRPKDKNCNKARAEYLKNFLEVEDTANGYLKAGCDGGQRCITMAIFKRPDGKYIVGVDNWKDGSGHDYYFLDYSNGKWTDVSAQVIPQFSKKNMYELPRNGTTIQVFAKKVIESGDGYEDTEKGPKLYDLEWKNGKFSKK